MVWNCPVPNCSTSEERNPEKLSSFKIPSNTEERIKWKNILNCEFLRSSRICEKHFRPNDVIQGYRREHNGEVLIDYQYKYKKLKKGALPNYRDYRQNFAYKMRRIKSEEQRENGHFKQTDVIQKIVLETTGRILIKSSVADKVHHEQFIEKSLDPLITQEKLLDPLITLTNHTASVAVSTNSDIDQIVVKIEDEKNLEPREDNSKEPNLYAILRKNLMEEVVMIGVPNSGWSMCRNTKSNTLAFVYADLLQNPFDDNKPQCFATKIVHLRDDKMIIWFRDKNIQNLCNETPESIKELHQILKVIDSYNICNGHPSVTVYPDVTLQSAYKDKFTWRHTKCPIALKHGSVCIHCTRIYKLLSESAERTMKGSNIDRFNNLTPRSRKKVLNLQRKSSQKTRLLSTQNKKIQKLNCQLNEYSCKLRKIE